MKNYLAIILAAIALGLGSWGLITMRADAKRSALAPVAASVLAQADKAATTTKKYQDNVDKANQNVRAAEADAAVRFDRITQLDQRMRSIDSTRAAARATADALRDYAADLDADFAECRAEYVALGGVAAEASIAAHGVAQGWPGQPEWAAAQAAFVKQAQELLK